MALSPLASRVADKIKADGISVAAAAEKIRVNPAGLGSLLKGKSTPNSRSVGRYAAFLGLSVEEVAALNGKPAKNGGKVARRGRKATAATSPKAGRKAKGGSVAAAIAAIQALEDKAALGEAILADKLAVAVHQASKRQRDLLSSILKVAH